ncbi:aminotransferase [Solemya pervernicosa gill symbiont]|uniref:Aminotransferase n=2 Tax=Gammaproteobacteria incertae sedis TaxID=118884 RepID=A0A1T2L1A3_9GAMM|nr:pyridoxal phosphate-dependent aminotransferase [Candidatus Reidiella endopervernicosa]OOZ38852.1 aminotransferase [Solemya pervernicosa gill symbiont]QKQ26568.1 pyridoxal phosphate-dependent aminotransferase [Candidatus Reidiella endopervernicosa]
MAAEQPPEAHIAQRMGEIEPFHVMDLLARARALEAEGRSIIHMEVGEPDFVTPEPIIEAGRAALAAGKTHYTPAVGLPALREALSAYYRDQLGADVPAERFIITPGASGALQLIMGVLVDPGDEVLMADPGYPCNRHFVRLFEGKAVGIPVDAESGYQLTLKQVEAHWSERSRAVLLASPANPTGTIVPEDELRAIVEFVNAKGGRVIVDEIYHGLIYADRPPSAAAISDQLFIVNSFSKYFGMTGWRLGWIVAPESYVREIDKLAQNIFLAAPTPAQHAALAAFEVDTLAILEQRRIEFGKRRDYLLPALRHLGFDIPITPQGAFYLYADCSRFSSDSYQLANSLLNDAGVAITPGLDFGSNQPERYLRFAYTTSIEKLKEGVARIEAWLHNNKRK